MTTSRLGKSQTSPSPLRPKQRPTKTFCACISTLIALAACTAHRKPPTDTLRMRLPGEPPSLDWTQAADWLSKEVIAALHEGLLEQDRDAKIRGALAESWTVSKDGLTYTFKLRAGLKWSDGRPLVAQHFVDAWERLLNPTTGAEYAYLLFDLVNGKDYAEGKLKDFSKVGVRALNELTLEAKLRTPIAYWIYIPSFWVTFPIRKDLITQHGRAWTDPGKLVSAGPYVLKAWEHDSRVVVERNPHYRITAEQNTIIPRIEYRVVKDDATAVALFDTGGLDVVRDLPPTQLNALAKRPDFKLFPYLRGYYIGFRLNDPSVSDVRVRRALAASLDRNEIAQALGVMAIPATNWLPEALLGGNAHRGIAFDAAFAKKLWSEIPHPPKQLELWYDQKDMNRLVMENAQNQWKRTLGVDVTLQSQEWKVYLKSLHSRAPALFRMGWGADYPDPNTFMALFHCKSGNNYSGFCSAVYDEAVDHADASLDPKVRALNYGRAEKILLEEQIAIVPLFTQRNLRLVSPRVENFYLNLMGDFLFREFRLASAPH